ncbi:outer membrane protein assembly factor BamA [Rheinheimera soli]|uniref:Outer membrane protein assembly factor BamA n=1 Tax=Rheinheimera soli TaxID=443616 RepID=A0ABU1W497_9GAMM|nr:outer membrane protein assembly factor BamA [Rheinheimera soli]MDR7122758.1 outer membrane protein insertion porin family [Rheinheimera soli]
MTIKRLVAAMLLAGLSNSVLAEQSFTVQDIQVEGLQRVALGAALNNLPFNIGDTITDATLSRSIKSLYAAGHFDDIQVFRDGNAVIYRLKERPTINNIEFDGNKDIKEDQLNESLMGQKIIVGEPLDKTVIKEVENGLTEFYHGVGKYNAEVEVKVTYLPRNRVNLKIEFEEGDAASVRQINIVGNEIFGDDELLKNIESKYDLPWWRFLSSDRYQKQTLQGDFEKIRSYYLDRGYLRFNIDANQVSVSTDKTSVYVTLNVTEGEQYTITDVDFVGDLIGQDAFIKALLPLKAGQLYNGALVTYTEESIARLLARFGYANSKVRTIPNIDDDTKEVALTISVDPGKRVYVRRLDVTGNASTKDEVIRREIRQMEGAWLSNDALELSKDRIQRLSYIEKVSFETKEVPGVDDKVDVTYKIKEQPSGNFNAGISYGDFQGLSFQIGVEQQNFFGTGNSAGISLSTNKYNRQIQLSVTDPYFTLDAISLGGQVFYSDTDYSSLSSNLEAYKQKRYGFGASVGYPINEYNRLNFGTNYAVNEINSLSEYDQLRHFRAVLVDKNDPDGGYKFTNYELIASWIQSTLNRGLFPTAGHEMVLSGRVTTPNSDLQYYKTTFSARNYIPLSNDHRWSFLSKLELGYGNGYGDKDGYDYTLPFTDNFYAGGQNLRGFEARIVGPHAIYRTITTVPGLPDPVGRPVNGLPTAPNFDTYLVSPRSTGGNAMAIATLELITPTPFVGEDYVNQIRTSLFVDAGNVWDTEFDLSRYKNLSPANSQGFNSPPLLDYSDAGLIRVSAGVSVQWISPMGPLTFSLAKVIRKEEGDEQENFSFNIGTTF